MLIDSDFHDYYDSTPSNPTVEIGDKYKAIAKGHDGRYSFRKPPGGGRWR